MERGTCTYPYMHFHSLYHAYACTRTRIHMSAWWSHKLMFSYSEECRTFWNDVLKVYAYSVNSRDCSNSPSAELNWKVCMWSRLIIHTCILSIIVLWAELLLPPSSVALISGRSCTHKDCLEQLFQFVKDCQKYIHSLLCMYTLIGWQTSYLSPALFCWECLSGCTFEWLWWVGN